jgi:hypothetical protein
MSAEAITPLNFPKFKKIKPLNFDRKKKIGGFLTKF